MHKIKRKTITINDIAPNTLFTFKALLTNQNVNEIGKKTHNFEVTYRNKNLSHESTVSFIEKLSLV
jgi:hypothetical protein